VRHESRAAAVVMVRGGVSARIRMCDHQGLFTLLKAHYTQVLEDESLVAECSTRLLTMQIVT